MSSEIPSPPPVIDGRYEVQQLVGTGGFGVVYRVRDLRCEGRELALKHLLPRRAEQPAVVQRFRQEGRVLARLKHEGVPRVWDVGEGYLVME